MSTEDYVLYSTVAEGFNKIHCSAQSLPAKLPISKPSNFFFFAEERNNWMENHVTKPNHLKDDVWSILDLRIFGNSAHTANIHQCQIRAITFPLCIYFVLFVIWSKIDSQTHGAVRLQPLSALQFFKLDKAFCSSRGSGAKLTQIMLFEPICPISCIFLDWGWRLHVGKWGEKLEVRVIKMWDYWTFLSSVPENGARICIVGQCYVAPGFDKEEKCME